MNISVLLIFIFLCLSLAQSSPNPTTPPAPCGLSTICIDSEECTDTIDAQLGQVVFQASVQTKNMFGQWSHACGGVVISENAVLTAASCLDSQFSGMARLSAGLVNLPKDGFLQTRKRRAAYPGEAKPGQSYIESVKKHPNYDKKTGAHNLAVLRLAMPLDFVKTEGNISNACLPKTKASKTSSNLFVSGWGCGIDGCANLRKVLRMRPVQITNCPAAFGKMNPNEFCVSQDLETTEANTKNTKENQLCEGDLGGPLFTDNVNEGSTVLGLTVRGPNCTDVQPSIFLDLFPYLHWINKESKPYY